MLNKVILMGRLTADPELRQTTSGISTCRFSVAVDRPYRKDQERQADFIRVNTWRQTAEFVSRYFSKGLLWKAVCGTTTIRMQMVLSTIPWRFRLTTFPLGNPKAADSSRAILRSRFISSPHTASRSSRQPLRPLRLSLRRSPSSLAI